MIAFNDITLATTAHNNAAMSAAMLQSFERYVGRVEEIIVVDDASREPITPATYLSPLRLLRNDRAAGFCKASDRALHEVRTPYALLVDADVLFEPGDFAGGLEEFRKRRWAWVNFLQVGLDGISPRSSAEVRIAPPHVFALGNKALMAWERRPRSSGAQSGRFVEAEAVHSSSTLVNMEAFRAVGGFDHWYWQCESDIDLSVRFRQMDYRIGVDTGYKVKHEGAGGKVGGDVRTLDLYRARLHFYERFYPMSCFYLRPTLFVRHLLETVYSFCSSCLQGDKPARLSLRKKMLRTVLAGYK